MPFDCAASSYEAPGCGLKQSRGPTRLAGLRGGEFIKRAFESQPQSDVTRQRAGVAHVVDDADVQQCDHALAGTQRAPIVTALATRVAPAR